MRAVDIWRYMDLAKLVTLLSRGLHFTKPTALGDPWEGSWGVKTIAAFKKDYFGRPDEGAEAWARRVDEKAELLNRFGLSCWHRSEVESAALWALYMPRGLGVAVRSTVDRVKAAADSIGRTIEALEVRYGEAEEGPIDARVLLARKRGEFQHEREVRFLLTFTSDEQNCVAWWQERAHERQSRWLSLSPVNGGLLRPIPGPRISDQSPLRRCTPAGVYLPLPLEGIVDAIHLAPCAPVALRHGVTDIVQRFGLEPDLIKDTSVDQVPPDRLEFF